MSIKNSQRALVFFLLLFLTQTFTLQALAQTVPSPYCIGSANSICNPSPSITNTPSTMVTIIASPTNDPCNTVNTASDTNTSQESHKHHKKGTRGAFSSFFQQFMTLLLQLLSQFFAQLGITKPIIGAPTLAPTQPVQPTIPVETSVPTRSITALPTIQLTSHPCPTATLTTATLTPVPTLSPTPTQTPSSSPIPSAIPVTSDCLRRSTIQGVSGAFTSQYGGSPANGSTLDARAGTWSMTDGWLATPASGHDVCWLGGLLKLTINDQVSSGSYKASPTNAWSVIWHHNGGFTTKNNNANWIFDGVAISHVGDAFNISAGSQNFEIRNSHLADVRDDCVQNDYYLTGSVHDNFFDGCYVGFSARASGAIPNGHANTWTIANNLIWIKPMWSVYKGDSPGNGELIKWDTTHTNMTPHLIFKNNFVRIGKTPFQIGATQGQFYFPPDIDFSGNTLYWDGAGSPPSSLTNMFNAAHNSKIVTQTEWNTSVNQWKQAHPATK